MKTDNRLDLENVPERMAINIERSETPEDAALRRFKEKYTFLAFLSASVLGLTASLYFILTHHDPASQRFSWSTFTGILGLIIGRQSRR